jgi:hypothetical protein
LGKYINASLIDVSGVRVSCPEGSLERTLHRNGCRDKKGALRPSGLRAVSDGKRSLHTDEGSIR